MELNFVGTGSAFSGDVNNSAYFIKDKNLFLIDCGENVFATLKSSKLLDKIDNVYVFITHTHSDHIGSLSTLAFYMNYAKNSKLNILTSQNYEIEKDIASILKLNGVKDDQYNFVDKDKIADIMMLKEIDLYRVKHVQSLKSYAIRFLAQKSDGELSSTIFTGDTCDEEFVKMALKDKYLDMLYCDVSIYGGPHLSDKWVIANLQDYKDKVTFMHFDSPFAKNRLAHAGFKTAEQGVKFRKVLEMWWE